jgi:hypothetical protein|tara:strand:- start:357 stop:509 length:153 start_codon:yes stop_codon:yes gene_type:complete
MKKRRSNIHYNEEIRDLTVSMFLKGSSRYQIEKAIEKSVAKFQMKKRGNK